jgi:hypothetical protein
MTIGMSSATRRRLWDVAQDRPDGRQGGDVDQKLLNDAGAQRETVFIVGAMSRERDFYDPRRRVQHPGNCAAT